VILTHFVLLEFLDGLGDGTVVPPTGNQTMVYHHHHAHGHR